MMIPKAHIIHQVRGRVRLKVADMRQEEDYFEDILSQLSDLPGIEDVRVNPLTGSILIHHPELSFNELEKQLSQQDLFQVVLAKKTEETALTPVFQGFSWVNQTLSEGSSGNVDLRSLGFLSLVGLAVYQIYRGNIMAPAIPLLWNAFDLAQRISQSETNKTSGSADSYDMPDEVE